MMSSLLRGAIAGACLACILPSVGQAADFYVAPDGNDSAAGTAEQPFATFARAQKAVYDRRERGEVQGPTTVEFRGGLYELAEPIRLQSHNSGKADSPIVYQAAAGQRPILSGGRRITGWQVGPDGRWRTHLAEVKAGQWSFLQLFVGDQRRYLTRLPKEGYFHVADHVKPAQGDKGFTQFVYGEGDLNPNWANRADVIVDAFHTWSTSMMRIAQIDPEKRLLTFGGATRGTAWWTAYAKGNRYRVLNVKEALSEPGQWYLDRPSGELTYIPMSGEDPARTVVVAPRLETLVLLEGDVAGHRWVEHVQFRGLTFAHSNWSLDAEGISMPQAATGVAEAIAAFGARNVTFDGCCVRHTGGYALGFGMGCRDNAVRNCELFDLGGGGVKVGYAGRGDWNRSHDVSRDPEALPSHHTIENCTIAHAGRLHPSAVGVWIGKSPYNKVLHNEIYDLYYTAVSLGWVWGYAPSPAHHNEIAHNHLHTIGQGVLSDMGGVYSLGIQPGTTIHHNHVHHVHSFSYGGWGLYTDEGSSDIVLSDNLVHHTKDGGFDQHYGRNNLVINNIFAFGQECLIRRNDRRDQHTSFTFERNIVLCDRGYVLGGGWGTSAESYYKLDHNLYWHVEGQALMFTKDLDFAAWQAKHGQDRNSLVADPLFVDAPGGDFRLRSDSPAIARLGFKPFDYSQAGRTSPPVMTKNLPPVPKAYD